MNLRLRVNPRRSDYGLLGQIKGLRLIVGLGNPGIAYRQTRHNVGFLAVQKLAKKKKFFFRRDRSLKSLIAHGKIKNHMVILALPQTFMNLSGEAVLKLTKKTNVPLAEMLVVCDDVALALGNLRMRAKGSHGGHKGLTSVIEKLGTNVFPRLRIGIGKQDIEEGLSGYVLSRFKKEEEPLLNKSLEKAVQAMEVWISEGIDKCMSRFNSQSDLCSPTFHKSRAHQREELFAHEDL